MPRLPRDIWHLGPWTSKRRWRGRRADTITCRTPGRGRAATACRSTTVSALTDKDCTTCCSHHCLRKGQKPRGIVQSFPVIHDRLARDAHHQRTPALRDVCFEPSRLQSHQYPNVPEVSAGTRKLRLWLPPCTKRGSKTNQLPKPYANVLESAVVRNPNNTKANLIL